MPQVVLILVFILAALLCARAAALYRSAHRTRTTPTAGGREFFCRVEPTRIRSDAGPADAFAIEMRGTLRVPRNHYDTDVQVLLADVTDDPEAPEPILATDPRWQMEDSPAFYLRAHNGPIPRRVAVLARWVRVAAVPCAELVFPRRGLRRVQCHITVYGRHDGRTVATASTLFTYTNQADGYLDKRPEQAPSARPIEALMVQLAVGVCHHNGHLPATAVETLRRWMIEQAQAAIPDEQTRHRAVQCLQDALDEALDLAADDRLDIEPIARTLAEQTTIVERYQAAALILETLAAEAAVLRHHTDRLASAADGLNIDREKVRAMAQKSLPLTTHDVEDLAFLFGIEPHMTADQQRRRLNDEYQKWNARVTHPDPDIRHQADRVLSLIAEARSRLLAETPAGAAD